MVDLLPKNATVLESSIDTLFGGRLDSMGVAIRRIWNPNTCPVELLTWLAWTYSVDIWSNNWTEKQKRQAVKDAYSLHHHKGTIGAMRRALTTLGYNINFQEWFEYGGRPYTFRVTTDDILTAAQIKETQDVIQSYKNARSLLDYIELPIPDGNSKVGGALTITHNITLGE